MEKNSVFEPLLQYLFQDGRERIISKENHQLWWNLGIIHSSNWKPNREKDNEVEANFLYLLLEMGQGNLKNWLSSPNGYLAFVIVADTLPRCIYRGKKECYQFENLAIEIVLEGIEKGIDSKLRPFEKAFFYMPLTHSEDESHQELSLKKYQELLIDCKKSILKYTPNDHNMISFYEGFLYSAKRHHLIMQYFKRFPNRNLAYNRTSTKEEVRYLKDPWHFFNDENAQ